jgi:hypothetical protein
VFAGVAVQLCMAAIASAAAVEALEADIESGGVVLGLLVDGVIAPDRGGTHDGIETLGAVLAVNRIGGRRLGQVCETSALVRRGRGAGTRTGCTEMWASHFGCFGAVEL